MKKFNALKILSILLVAAFALGFVATEARAEKPGDTIVEIALGNDNFETLVAAVVKADLVDTLNGNRMFTVFAPTDDAFDAAAEAVLGPGYTGMDLVDALDKETLTSILLYHVAPGERFSGDVVSAERIRTMSKGFIFVDGTTLVGNNSSANLILDLIDIDASNGVIHVIDFVLLP
jgi:transforming growth factor-beta-induced protein